MFRKPSTPFGDADSIRLLNQPRPLAVSADRHGVPHRIDHGAGWRSIVQIVDVWRIDDEWWRTSVSRRYFLVELDDGIVRTMFQDLVGGGWYQQHA